jgi:8-oxo-dGTP pyrophosphatase MutT (NUDIX family)
MKKKKLVRRARRGKPIEQVAALPYRFSADGELEVLLLTSRGTGRFIVPKGWPMKGLKDRDAAAQEAAEEAGVKGVLGKEPMGSFQYWKRLDDSFVPVNVSVYPLLVELQLAKWKECDARERAWVKPQEAALLVDEPALVSLLNSIATFNVSAQAKSPRHYDARGRTSVSRV